MLKRINGRRALCGGLGIALLLAASPLRAQESGAEVWARACGRCHRAQPAQRYDADTWHAITVQMGLYARLTTDEEEAVREFLMATARRVAEETRPQEAHVRLASTDPTFIPSVQPDAAEIFTRNCAPCHGKEGKGDGPAAPALTPRPADLTDHDLLAQVNDDELLQLISQGKGAMPAFRTMLSEEQLQAMVEYVRGLSSDTIP